jgi:hypothetical protein
MGNTFEISTLLASLAKPLAQQPKAHEDLIEEMTIHPLPRYPKFSLANLERDLRSNAPSLRFALCDLSYDSTKERTDGEDVQKLCITFNPAADIVVAAQSVMDAVRREYDRKGMEWCAGELDIDYKPASP